MSSTTGVRFHKLGKNCRIQSEMSAASMSKVRVRIAPSPTGFAHVGTAYTALFNYAVAKKSGGTFVLRLEDTDVKRNVKGAEQAIYDGLSWIGLSWDEGPDKGGDFEPYRQSERLDLYKKRVEVLLEKGMAYEDEGAVRFKNPNEDISWNDLVRGEIKFPGDQVTDFVILKSDGYPTYNFAVAIDDIEMKITHVIRGEEHISNTPRQIALYKALGERLPEFAHTPTLRNKERKKLSKRRDPVDLRLYKEDGILPEALLNFLAHLGWSHPEEKEIFSLDEFVKLFDLVDVRKAGPIFDTDKLEWINGQYIRELSDNEFIKRAKPFYPKGADTKVVEEIAPLVKERIRKLSEFAGMTKFFFEAPEIDEKALGDNSKEHLKQAISVLEEVESWDRESVDKVLLKLVEENNFHTGKFFMDIRIAITGQKVTPPINDSVIALGKEETLNRLKKLVK
jgi:glutamyl-tRNA synthetase